MMIQKKIILSLFFIALSILTLNGVLAYTFQIPLCNSTINESCINVTSVAPIINAPLNGVMFWQDGNLYLTNETSMNYSINNYNNTYLTTNLTNITNYYYNATNGSDIIIMNNITANETYLKEWVNSNLNTTTLSIIYNGSNVNATLALRTEINELRNLLTTTYATKNNLSIIDSKYSYLLVIKTNGSNAPINLDDFRTSDDEINFGMTWKVISIINLILIILLIILVAKTMMSDGGGVGEY